MVILLLVVVAGAVLLVREATIPYITLASINPSEAASASARQKLASVTSATQQAQTSGQPTPVSVTLSDAEMTSLVSDALKVAAQTGSAPAIDGVAIHAAGHRRMQVVARLHEPFVTLPLYLDARVSTPGRTRFDVIVSELRIGMVPLPAGLIQGIADQVRQQLAQRVSLPASGRQPIDKVGVAVGTGSLTVTATAEP